MEGDHQKGEGAGGGVPLPRGARKLLKTLIQCAKMHEKITSFFTYAAFCVLCNRRKGGVATPPTPPLRPPVSFYYCVITNVSSGPAQKERGKKGSEL